MRVFHNWPQKVQAWFTPQFVGHIRWQNSHLPGVGHDVERAFWVRRLALTEKLDGVGGKLLAGCHVDEPKPLGWVEKGEVCLRALYKPMADLGEQRAEDDDEKDRRWLDWDEAAAATLVGYDILENGRHTDLDIGDWKYLKMEETCRIFPCC